MSSITINAKFQLKGVNVEDVKTKYCDGEYKSLNSIQKIDSFDTEPMQSSKSRKEDKNDHSLTVLMAEKIKIVNNGKTITRCDYCRDEIKGVNIGLPVKSSYDPVSKITTFTCTGSTGHFECSKAMIRKYKNSIMYENSENLLYVMFNICYPNSEMKLCREWYLHENWGGVLTSEEFHSSDHVYYDTGMFKIEQGVNRYIEGK